MTTGGTQLALLASVPRIGVELCQGISPPGGRHLLDQYVRDLRPQQRGFSFVFPATPGRILRTHGSVPFKSVSGAPPPGGTVCVICVLLPMIASLTYVVFTDNSRLSLLLFWAAVLAFQAWAARSQSWVGLIPPVIYLSPVFPHV